MSESTSATKGPPGRARGRELALWLMSHVEGHLDGHGNSGQARAALELFFHEPLQLDAGDAFLGAHADELVALLDDRVARRWARRLLDAYLDDPQAIDQSIEAASRRWRLERMDRVDRNLLRLCAVELRHESTPRNVVVAEAVRLAARYGSERSVAFVNALAETLARTLRDASQGDIDEPEPEDGEEASA